LKGGSQEAEAEFFSEIARSIPSRLFVIYALIAVAFRSYSLPLLIMTAMPFGFMGAVFGHLIFNLPMALFSYFGIGAAAGVVVNDNLGADRLCAAARARGHGASQGAGDLGGESLQAYFPDHGHHLCRFDSDHGRAIHQRPVPEASGVVAGLRRVLCAVRQFVAGARDVSDWLRLAAAAARREKSAKAGEGEIEAGLRQRSELSHAVHHALEHWRQK
jgi:hypothetical protein